MNLLDMQCGNKLMASEQCSSGLIPFLKKINQSNFISAMNNSVNINVVLEYKQR